MARQGLFQCLLFLMLLPAMAGATERIALVIGNGKYTHVAELENPVSDARLMAQTLEGLGFEVTLLTDSGQRKMKQAIAAFGRKLRTAGPDAVSLFYYAGHGVQAQGANYLVPTDADVLDEADLYLVGVEADWVLRQMASARLRTNIVILDACRDNPFSDQGLEAQGLARMNAPTGSFVAYSTAPGAVALDGAGRNSPFTAALAREVTVPGRPIEAVFRAVRAHVVEETSGAQTPWDSSSLIDTFYFQKPASTPPTISAAEERLWSTVRDSGDLVQLALFLRAYPNSAHAEEARRMLIEQSGSSPEPTTPATPSPAPLPDAERAHQQTAVQQAQDSPPSSPAADLREAPNDDAAFAAAVQANRSEAYRAYLDRFPNGRHVAEARDLLASLPATQTPAEALPAPKANDSAPAFDLASVTVAFDTPLPIGTRGIEGRTLREIVSGTPIYPPIAGLDPTLWQDQPCSMCHQWTQAALCAQGEFYLTAPEERIADKNHPMGEMFLRALARWAETGCL